MSLHGMLRFHGATFSSTRASQTRDALGAATGTAAAVVTDALIYVEQIASSVALQQFGTETKATLLGVIEADVDVVVGDILVVTGGPYDGQTLRVTDEHQLPVGPTHRVLGLSRVPAGTEV